MKVLLMKTSPLFLQVERLGETVGWGESTVVVTIYFDLSRLQNFHRVENCFISFYNVLIHSVFSKTNINVSSFYSTKQDKNEVQRIDITVGYMLILSLFLFVEGSS